MGYSLEGIQVLDLTRALSGPYCTMLLSDMGADVIKVEPPEGDMCRTWGPFDRGESLYFCSANRNKRSLALDLRSNQGRRVVARLAASCDVVVENFRPGVMARMGLAYEELSARNPRLVQCSVTAYGSTGPMSGWPGFDQIAQGLSGLMSVTGHPETGPVRSGVAIGDLVCGIYAALAVTGALVQRERTGRGQLVSTSLLGSLVSLLTVQGQRYLSLGQIPVPQGNDNPTIAPYGLFQAQDGPFNVAVASPEIWKKLCQVIGLSHLLEDPRFTENEERHRHKQQLSALLNEQFREHSKDFWVKRLNEAGIPSGPIDSVDRVFANPQVAALGLIEEIEHNTLGTLPVIGSALRFQDVDRVTRRPPPGLGEHSEEILAEFGFGLQEIAELRDAGVLATK